MCALLYPHLLPSMTLAPSQVPAELEGESFLPLLQSGNEQSQGKPRVFSQYPHGLVEGAALPAHGHANASGSVMGYTMRTVSASVVAHHNAQYCLTY
eukprot:COSAG02_NODE_1793_length_10918_cov_41.286533_2_plen_97_part_00